MQGDNLKGKIKDLRIKAGLSMRELSQKIGVSEATISRWESGNINNMRRDKIATLANALGTTPGYLMGWTDEPGKIPSAPNIEPLPPTRKVPLIGTIACGTPILAEENIEDYFRIPEKVRADFCLRCKGDSMINAHIFDGSLVFIRKQPDVDDGEIAAVLIDDEATLKRVRHIPNGIMLLAENPAFPALVYTAADCVNVRILGKAVACLNAVR